MKIGCAILAGGKSSRMGTDKALLEYEGKQNSQKEEKDIRACNGQGDWTKINK